MAVPEFNLTEVAPLMDNLPEPVGSEEVLTMEDLDMGFGSVLYRTPLPSLPDGALLRFDGHDYAQVFVNGRYIGKLDRRVNERELRLPATASGDFPGTAIAAPNLLSSRLKISFEEIPV